ncbi:MAG: hypothetical protein V7629_18800, partial [Motiliproteus sp.]
VERICIFFVQWCVFAALMCLLIVPLTEPIADITTQSSTSHRAYRNSALPSAATKKALFITKRALNDKDLWAWFKTGSHSAG